MAQVGAANNKKSEALWLNSAQIVLGRTHRPVPVARSLRVGGWRKKRLALASTFPIVIGDRSLRATMHELIRDISLCIGTAWLLGVLAQWLRQPPLLAYLVGGFLLGPSCLRWVLDAETIGTISELGLIFLLFMIGLEIDLKKIIAAGRSITVTALVQIVGGCLIGVGVFFLCGFALGGGHGWDALYLAVAAALSSTVIIVKVLHDQHELDTLAGRVTLGVLVLQDLFAILFLAIQPSLDQLKITVLLLSLVRVAALVLTTLAVSRYVLPPLFRRVARLPELVLVGALAWCFLVGELAERLHLSREMGALVAGVALSTFPYALDVTAKVTSLRDFFVTLFFVSLGLKIPLPTWGVVELASGFAVFTVISRFATTFTPLYRMNSGLRLSLLPAIYLAQVSEFSLVVLELGVKSKHVSERTAAAVPLAFVGLAVLSTFGMTRSDSLVRQLIPWLKRRGLRDLDDGATQVIRRREIAEGPAHSAAKIVLLGFFRTASSLLDELTRHAPDLLPQVAVVDFSPVVHAELRQRGLKVIYGDISQRDTLAHAGVSHAEVIVCTVPDSLLKGITNEKLVRQLRELNPTARIIAPAELLDEVPRLRAAGADYVSLARLNVAADLYEAIRAAEEGLLSVKQGALETQLRERQEVLP
jgi:Kef-type K+ transport system membrane component KefB/voltage-gated potassium channel Kch